MFLSTSSCDRPSKSKMMLMIDIILFQRRIDQRAFLDDREVPENKSGSPEHFNCQSFESWSSHCSVNLASIFFVTAFLGLLAKGPDDIDFIIYESK